MDLVWIDLIELTNMSERVSTPPVYWPYEYCREGKHDESDEWNDDQLKFESTAGSTVNGDTHETPIKFSCRSF